MKQSINIAEVEYICKRCSKYMMCLRRYSEACAAKKVAK